MEPTFRFIEKDRMGTIIPLLRALNPAISETVLKERLQEMLLNNYHCVGVFDEERLIGISGLWILNKYYVGKHLEPDNVYLLSECQGKGIGKRLMNWIFDYGKSIGCVASELNCYVKNEAGQRFWEQQGYKKVAYHYQKEL